MSKKLFTIFLLFLSTIVHASVYEKNCINCHKKIPVSIDKYFYRYLLKYSSETKVKNEIKIYIQKPSKEKTVMADAFINRFGIKQKTKLSEQQLNEAVNEYWEIYKIFGKLK